MKTSPENRSEIERLLLPKNTAVQLRWNETPFWLLPEKAVYLPEISAVLIADPHFGKAAHFRKAGVPIPEMVHAQDLIKIQKLIQSYQPEAVYFLGDLFHSEWNTSWTDLEEFASYFPRCAFHLVKGNHDILPERLYRSDIWEVHQKPLSLGNFLLSHEPLDEIPAGLLNFCGHIHPGIALYGRAKQRMVLPCFFQSGSQMILPAFGRFTGIVSMSANNEDRAFAIAEKKVVEVKFC